MGLTLYYHPFSNFCQKAVIALYETKVAFEPRVIDLGNAEQRAELESQWPLVKFPVLRDSARSVTVPESSLIVGYLDHHYSGPARLIPEDFDTALSAHLLDRLIDNCLMVPVGKVVTDTFRAEGRHDPDGVEQAKATIVQGYGILERDLPDRGWAVGPDFTLADCAAAPGLFYAGTVVPFDSYPKVTAYFGRLLQRPSVVRAIDEARPYRANFPLPWPDSYV